MSLQTERQRTRTLREIVAEDQARSSRRIERRQLARKIIVLPTPKPYIPRRPDGVDDHRDDVDDYRVRAAEHAAEATF